VQDSILVPMVVEQTSRGERAMAQPAHARLLPSRYKSAFHSHP